MEIISPSKRKTMPKVAPHRATDLLAIVSNTGCSSPGDELMTLSTSAVAVCCSSDLQVAVRACSSLSNRVFSMAMTAWSAKS